MRVIAIFFERRTVMRKEDHGFLINRRNIIEVSFKFDLPNHLESKSKELVSPTMDNKILEAAVKKSLTVPDDHLENFLSAFGVILIPVNHAENNKKIIKKQLQRIGINIKGNKPLPQKISDFAQFKINLCEIKNNGTQWIKCPFNNLLFYLYNNLYFISIEGHDYLLTHLIDSYQTEQAYANELIHYITREDIICYYFRWLLEKKEVLQLAQAVEDLLKKLLQASSVKELPQQSEFYFIKEIIRLSGVTAKANEFVLMKIKESAIKWLPKIAQERVDHYVQQCEYKFRELNQEIEDTKELLEIKSQQWATQNAKRFEKHLTEALSIFSVLSSKMIQQVFLSASDFPTLMALIKKYHDSWKNINFFPAIDQFITLKSLRTYYGHTAQFARLMQTINTIFAEPQIYIDPGDSLIMVIRGGHIVLDEELLRKIGLMGWYFQKNWQQTQHIKCLKVQASGILYINGNFNLPGITLQLRAKKIHFDERHLLIDTSGRDAKSLEEKTAASGRSYRIYMNQACSMQGADGADGQRGEDGGNIIIEAKESIINLESLTVRARGGHGADGQNGGDGDDGMGGKDGTDAKAEDRSSIIHYKPRAYFEQGSSGTPGERGGNGGVAGQGGEGGSPGVIGVKVGYNFCLIKTDHSTWLADGRPIDRSGKDGISGRPGKGGQGGLGGKQGVDDGYQWRFFSGLLGSRTEHLRGQLTYQPYSYWLGTGQQLLLLKNELDYRNQRATPGERGQEGRAIFALSSTTERKKTSSHQRYQKQRNPLEEDKISRVDSFGMQDEYEEEKSALLGYEIDQLTQRGVLLTSQRDTIRKQMSSLVKIVERVNQLAKEAVSQVMSQVSDRKAEQATILRDYRFPKMTYKTPIKTKQKKIPDIKIHATTENHFVSDFHQYKKNLTHTEDLQQYAERYKDFILNEYRKNNKIELLVLVESQLEDWDSILRNEHIPLQSRVKWIGQCYDALKKLCAEKNIIMVRYSFENLSMDSETVRLLNENPILLAELEKIDIFKKCSSIPFELRSCPCCKQVTLLNIELFEIKQKSGKEAQNIIDRLLAIVRDKAKKLCIEEIVSEEKILKIEDAKQAISLAMENILDEIDEKFIQQLSDEKEMWVAFHYYDKLKTSVQYVLKNRTGDTDLNDIRLVYLYTLIRCRLTSLTKKPLPPYSKEIRKNKRIIIEYLLDFLIQVVKTSTQTELSNPDIRKTLFLISKLPLSLSDMDETMDIMRKNGFFDNERLQPLTMKIIRSFEENFSHHQQKSKIDEICDKLQGNIDSPENIKLSSIFTEVIKILSFSPNNLTYTQRHEYYNVFLKLLNEITPHNVTQKIDNIKNKLSDLNKQVQFIIWKNIPFQKIQIYSNQYNSISDQLLRKESMFKLFDWVIRKSLLDWFSQDSNQTVFLHYLKVYNCFLSQTLTKESDVLRIYIHGYLLHQWLNRNDCCMPPEISAGVQDIFTITRQNLHHYITQLIIKKYNITYPSRNDEKVKSLSDILFKELCYLINRMALIQEITGESFKFDTILNLEKIVEQLPKNIELFNTSNLDIMEREISHYNNTLMANTANLLVNFTKQQQSLIEREHWQECFFNSCQTLLPDDKQSHLFLKKIQEFVQVVYKISVLELFVMKRVEYRSTFFSSITDLFSEYINSNSTESKDKNHVNFTKKIDLIKETLVNQIMVELKFKVPIGGMIDKFNASVLWLIKQLQQEPLDNKIIVYMKKIMLLISLIDITEQETLKLLLSLTQLKNTLLNSPFNNLLKIVEPIRNDLIQQLMHHHAIHTKENEKFLIHRMLLTSEVSISCLELFSQINKPSFTSVTGNRWLIHIVYRDLQKECDLLLKTTPISKIIAFKQHLSSRLSLVLSSQELILLRHWLELIDDAQSLKTIVNMFNMISPSNWLYYMQESLVTTYYQKFIQYGGVPKTRLLDLFGQTKKPIDYEIDNFIDSILYYYDSSQTYQSSPQAESEHITDFISSRLPGKQKVISELVEMFKTIIYFRYCFHRNFAHAEFEGNLDCWFESINLMLIKIKQQLLASNGQYVKIKDVSDIMNEMVSAADQEDVYDILSEKRCVNWLRNLVINRLKTQLGIFWTQRVKNITRKAERLNFILNKIPILETPTELLQILADKLSRQNQLSYDYSAIEAYDFEKFIDLINYKNISDETIERLREKPFSSWNTELICRRERLPEPWPMTDEQERLRSQCANWLLALTNKLKVELIDNLIQLIGKKSIDYIILADILDNVTRGIWILNDKTIDKLRQNNYENWVKIIDTYSVIHDQKDDDDIPTLVGAIKTDFFASDSKLASLPIDEKALLSLNNKIVQASCGSLIEFSNKSIDAWGEVELSGWAKFITRKSSADWLKKNIHYVMAILGRAVQLKYGVNLHPTQYFTLWLLLATPDQQKGRLAQVLTGQGKTLIIAMFAILKVWLNEYTDVVTSSRVRAEKDIATMTPLYQLFGLKVTNNCDEKCQTNNKDRRERYQGAHIVYGDIASFERDYLLTEFLRQGIYAGRRSRAVIIDEVDSLLLDKSDNVLYLSHALPDLHHFRMLYCEIWVAVNAPDVQSMDSLSIAHVVQYIKKGYLIRNWQYPNIWKN